MFTEIDFEKMAEEAAFCGYGEMMNRISKMVEEWWAKGNEESGA